MSFGNLNRTDNAKANRGIIVYWQSAPKKIIFGAFKRFLKSLVSMLVPIPNMAAAKNSEVYLVIKLKLFGYLRAQADKNKIIMMRYFSM